jgi:hypothetical protein
MLALAKSDLSLKAFKFVNFTQQKQVFVPFLLQVTFGGFSWHEVIGVRVSVEVDFLETLVALEDGLLHLVGLVELGL